MRSRVLGVLLTAVLCLVMVGCGDDEESGGGGGGELTVSAATSLTNAFEALGGARFSFAGSDELAAQIRQGAQVDVFASANTTLPDDLFEEDLVEEPQVFAGNKLVLAVPADDAKVETLDDLTDDGVTIAIGTEDVPIGAYTREVLGKLPDEQAILANVRSNEPDVGGIVGKVTQGAVDAGFVYVTDVEASGGELQMIELPQRVSPVVEYGVAVVADSDDKAGAQEFIDSLIDGPGREELVKAGFSIP